MRWLSNGSTLDPVLLGLALELGRLDAADPNVAFPALDRLAQPAIRLVALLPRLLRVLFSAVPMMLGTRMALVGWGGPLAPGSLEASSLRSRR